MKHIYNINSEKKGLTQTKVKGEKDYIVTIRNVPNKNKITQLGKHQFFLVLGFE